MVELRFISQGLYSQDDRRLLMELFRITPVAALSRQVMNRELAVDHYRNTLLNNDKYTEQYDVEFLSKTITLAAHTTSFDKQTTLSHAGQRDDRLSTALRFKADFIAR